MSHAVDFEGMEEKLIVLQHFVYGSKSYCLDRDVGSERDVGEAASDEYWGWLKAITSNYLLECAIKFRVVLDFISRSDRIDEIEEMDIESRQDLLIGEIVQGDVNITLREFCNKIIHARSVVPIWQEVNGELGNYKFWSGKISLSGRRSGRDWKITLFVGPWAKSLQKFLAEASSREYTFELGQD